MSRSYVEASVSLLDLFASMDAGVYATDREGRLLMANPEALRLLDRNAEELRGRTVHDVVHFARADGTPVAAGDCPLLAVVQSGEAAHDDDDVFWRGDGTPLPVAWSSTPLVQRERVTGAVVVFRPGGGLAQHPPAGSGRVSTAGLSLLAQVGDVIDTLDAEEALRRVARLLVARLADWCVIDSYAGGSVERVALALARQDRPVQQSYLGPLPPLSPLSGGSLARALTSGRPQRVSPVSSSGSDPLDLSQESLFAALGAAHALVVPLLARHAVVGAVTLVRLDRTAPFTDTEEQLAVDVAHRVAIATDHARRYAQQRQVAETLQSSLLAHLPAPPDLELAARYVPATAGAGVGGDWYDALPLTESSTWLVIGDVVGHDLAAASQMSQVRSMLRGIVSVLADSPGLVLAQLDRALQLLIPEVLATALVARMTRDGAGYTLTWSNAGHPPLALVSAAGRVRTLRAAPELMLGVEPTPQRRSHQLTLAPGDTVWLYTDGLVESSEQPMEQGLVRLRRALAAVAGLPLDGACDELLARMLRDPQTDDAAVLAVRPRPKPAP